MATNFLRSFKFGLQNFLRNGLVSFAAIATLTLVLNIFLVLMLFISLGNNLLTKFQDKIDIAVYFNGSVSEDEIFSIKTVIEKLDEVKNVDYVSKDRALEIFTEKHKGDQVIMRALKEIDDNPLLASLSIKAKQPDKYQAIAGYLDGAVMKDKISKVTYAQNSVIINRLIKLIETVKLGGLGAILFLGIIASIVVVNTIRLVIYSSRSEIEIARLVGASNFLIQGPYVITAVIYALVSAIASMIIFWPLIYFSAPYLRELTNEIDVYKYVMYNFASFFGYVLMLGLALSVVSSVFAVKKYTKV